MKIINRAVLCLILSLGFISCDDYEDYTQDFDYSIVYFSTQRPLRTAVAYEEMQFKVGVALAGKRENTVNESVDFIIDPSLLDDEKLDGAGAFTLLPENYYSLSDSEMMVIPAGEFIGDVTVSLNRDLFTSDPLATTNTYALPFQLTGTTVDSIATGNDNTPAKDYTIVVVKYISPYSGAFYHTGVQTGTDGSSEEYTDTDLINTEIWDIQTVDRITVTTPGIGDFNAGSLTLDIDENDNSVTVSSESAGFENVTGSGSYDFDDREFSLSYSFTRNEIDYTVEEVLVLRRPPEQDLSFEEW